MAFTKKISLPGVTGRKNSWTILFLQVSGEGLAFTKELSLPCVTGGKNSWTLLFLPVFREY
jgi:hypothetical protein